MNTTCVLPIVLVVFVLNFVKVNGIKCFQCNSVEHPGCEDLTTEDLNSPYLKDCVENHSNSTPFCRKTKYIILDKEGFLRISRECGWILHRDNTTRCYDVDTDFKYEISLTNMSRALIYVFLACVCVGLFRNVEAFGQFCEESGIQFKKGETITVPGECVSFTCEEPGVNLMVGKRCEEKKSIGGCKVEPGDDSKEFPDCCPKLIC
ncbi:hypothetical protein RN001_013011 [Aquatica leii]|uniref:Single domain-containing protein n=1 Tax=Aquatica leii TaxID=1421715 RepID=A0AAN7P3S3_9COLE|nr:hypothetical protein RN001_013011 [Aquatica leii]